MSDILAALDGRKDYRRLVWDGLEIQFNVGIQATSPADDPWKCQRIGSCDNCDLPCVMWMCATEVWNELPEAIREAWLCLDCFAMFRRLKEIDREQWDMECAINGNGGPNLLLNKVLSESAG